MSTPQPAPPISPAPHQTADPDPVGLLTNDARRAPTDPKAECRKRTRGRPMTTRTANLTPPGVGGLPPMEGRPRRGVHFGLYENRGVRHGQDA